MYVHLFIHTTEHIACPCVFTFREHTISSLTETGGYHGAGAGRDNLLHGSYVKP